MRKTLLIVGAAAFLLPRGTRASTLEFSTYLGGSGREDASAIAVDASGGVYATGSTSSLDFPLAAPFLAAYGGGVSDAFVTKLDVTGVLIYSTFVGGSYTD